MQHLQFIFCTCRAVRILVSNDLSVGLDASSPYGGAGVSWQQLLHHLPLLLFFDEILRNTPPAVLPPGQVLKPVGNLKEKLDVIVKRKLKNEAEMLTSCQWSSSSFILLYWLCISSWRTWLWGCRMVSSSARMSIILTLLQGDRLQTIITCTVYFSLWTVYSRFI